MSSTGTRAWRGNQFGDDRLGHDAAGGEDSSDTLAGRFQRQERERHVLRLLERSGMLPLSGKRILEVGCGTGRWLRDLTSWGADPESLFGVDLLPASVSRARRLCPPAVTIECSNAANLSFPSQSFDLVLQALVFTSVLDPETRRAMAAEMLRVLRPQGLILWYDLSVQSPWNSCLQPVRPADILRLFPGCTLDLRRVGLASGLTQLIAPRSWTFCSILSSVPSLCTHYLGALRRHRTL